MFALQYGARRAGLPARARFVNWVRAALHTSASITLRIIGAREARMLNHRYRGRDYATNVLTFVYQARRPLSGDIAICAPVVARESREKGISRDAHYAHLTIHGVLHLQGHDHQRARDAERMERLEARIMKRLGYADPYRNDDNGSIKEARRKRRRISRTHGRRPT